LKTKKKDKESLTSMCSIVETKWKALMEDKWATMGAKVDSMESKVFAMSEFISIIKNF
jgi:hypothetical protein